MKAEEIVIRRARPDENDSVHALVQAIVDETFAYIFAPSQVPLGEPNCISTWVAILGEEIVGVTLTRMNGSVICGFEAIAAGSGSG